MGYCQISCCVTILFYFHNFIGWGSTLTRGEDRFPFLIFLRYNSKFTVSIFFVHIILHILVPFLFCPTFWFGLCKQKIVNSSQNYVVAMATRVFHSWTGPGTLPELVPVSLWLVSQSKSCVLCLVDNKRYHSYFDGSNYTM